MYAYKKDVFYDGDYLTFEEKNKKGEKMIIQIQKIIHEPKCKTDIIHYLVSNGKMDKPLSSWWFVDTYVEDANGNCRKDYDPTMYYFEKYDNKGNVVESGGKKKPEWILEATKKNYDKIIYEIGRMFFGMIPTERRTGEGWDD